MYSTKENKRIGLLVALLVEEGVRGGLVGSLLGAETSKALGGTRLPEGPENGLGVLLLLSNDTGLNLGVALGDRENIANELGGGLDLLSLR